MPGPLLAPDPSTWTPWQEPAPILPGEGGYPTTVPALVRLLRGPAPSAERRELVRRAFASHDVERCGLLERAQFEAALRALNIRPAKGDLEAIWRAASPDGFYAPFSEIVDGVFDDGGAENWLDVSNELQQTYDVKEPPPPTWIPELLEKARACPRFQLPGRLGFGQRVLRRPRPPACGAPPPGPSCAAADEAVRGPRRLPVPRPPGADRHLAALRSAAARVCSRSVQPCDLRPFLRPPHPRF